MSDQDPAFIKMQEEEGRAYATGWADAKADTLRRIDYEAAVRTWEEYEQDADPYENRTYEQMIRDAVDAAVKEDT